MEIINATIDATLENIKSAKEYLDEESLDKFEEILISSKNIFLIGAGRSGLVAKAFARRLTHIGLKVYVVGETTSHPIGEEDCLVAISGSGETETTVNAARIASYRGSKVLALTSYPDSTLGSLSDVLIQVKGRVIREYDGENYMRRQIYGNFTSLTPLGTIFELTSLVLLDAIIAEMMERLMNPF